MSAESPGRIIVSAKRCRIGSQSPVCLFFSAEKWVNRFILLKGRNFDVSCECLKIEIRKDCSSIWTGSNMSSGFKHVCERSKQVTAKPPSLVDLCVQTAIGYIRYLGDVGETDIHLLERILPHCTIEQLMHVENCTEGRDLTQVTNKLWKKFYEAKFGAKHTNDVVERIKKSTQKFSWRQLYEAKLKVQDEAQKQSLERLTQLYKKEDARRQSRQIQICTKTPPSGKKRCFGGGYGAVGGLSNVKSNIMKKAKIEYLNSQEIKNRTAIKRNPMQKSHGVYSSTSKPSTSEYKPRSSQCQMGNLPCKDYPSSFTYVKKDKKDDLKKNQGNLLGKDYALASRLTETFGEANVKNDPCTVNGKPGSFQRGKSISTSISPGIDQEDDIRRKLIEFW